MSMLDELIENAAKQYAGKAAISYKHNMILTLEAASPPTYENPFGSYSKEDADMVERYAELAKKAEYEKAKGRISDMFRHMIKECLNDN